MVPTVADHGAEDWHWDECLPDEGGQGADGGFQSDEFGVVDELQLVDFAAAEFVCLFRDTEACCDYRARDGC